MKTWSQLFIRHGWWIEEEEEQLFNCETESTENMKFLLETLKQLKVHFTYQHNMLKIITAPIAEKDFIKIIDFPHRGRTEMIGEYPTPDQPYIRNLDTYISGLVRQLNRLRFYTVSSCDGHERGPAYILFTSETNQEQLLQLLSSPSRRGVRASGRPFRISLPLAYSELLRLAEKLGTIKVEWMDKGIDFIKEQLFYNNLEQLLKIPGASGNEEQIRKVVLEKLAPFVDDMTVDRSGNILAEKTYRGGDGPTILLNAHLDIASEIEAGRSILKEHRIWRSTKGILGADDRAGVAVLLQMAENLIHSSFRGKVKFIFTVEEECGLQGARRVDNYFLWGTDAAFVMDRKGTSDIVTSCWGEVPYCTERFGRFVEHIANQANLNEWKCTAGGSSDTKIWANHGIQSVNLSVGYGNEHTEDEFLDVAACFNVTRLLHAVFANSRELRRVVRSTHRLSTPINRKVPISRTAIE